MPTDDTASDERYRAVRSRDARFDGQFVMAVRTTGIYCRPSCPARTPVGCPPAKATRPDTSTACTPVARFQGSV